MKSRTIWCNLFGWLLTPSYCKSNKQKKYLSTMKTSKWSYASSTGGRKRINNHNKTKRNKK